MALAVSAGLFLQSPTKAATDFTRDIQPILSEHCVRCHGPEKQKGGLRLDLQSDAFKGGDSGERAIVPGDAAHSRLLKLITSTDKDDRMPPKGDPLSAEQIATVRRWIDEGASWPTSEPTVPSLRRSRTEMVVTDEDRKFWSLRPLAHVEPPPVQDRKWIRTPVDKFILAALQSKNLTPTAPAEKRKLIRRVYFDLVGLPPRPDEIDAFVNNRSNKAYAKLIDRLLASPRFGERWSRHWLDVARYADSKGYERDSDRPNAFHYRDFVIRAMNDDLPFDTFVKWQLAGDELSSSNTLARVATFFIGAGSVVETDTKLPSELARYRYADLDDMISTTGSAMLGLSIGCARCHDHKYDPIPTRDYYRMLCAFTSVERSEMPLVPAAEVSAYEQQEAAYKQRLEATKKNLSDWLTPSKAGVRPALIEAKKSSLKPGEKEPKLSDDDFRSAFTEAQREQWNQLSAAVKEVESTKPKPLPAASVVTLKRGSSEKNFLMDRGDANSPKVEVELGFLTALTGKKSAADYLKNAPGSRAALADWLTDPDNGAGHLLARVIVNRLWQHHFGEGLVRTPSDFGSQGEPPSHPELLDWLASELIRNGWHLKPLHKLIVTSAVYLQDTTFDDAQAKIDPDDRLLWRRRPRRLEAEILRDSMLAVSGCLNTNMFGPGVKPPIPAELLLAYNTSDPYPTNVVDAPETWRRSVYLFHKRSSRYPMLEVFDGADPSASCARRNTTTVAPQALALLNDEFVRRRARDFAGRVMRETGSDPRKQIEAAYRLALGRTPNQTESREARQFLLERAKSRAKHGELNSSPALALADFCQVLLGLNEFLYVD